MLRVKPVGRNAAAMKYDVLTALGSFALSKGKSEQRLTLRLITLITARYSWARDELAIGQREIARLWHVDERTVKREMAKFRAMGWLIVTRPGARGRVTEYRLGLDRILADTTRIWAAIGPDFESRLSVPKAENIVPLPIKPNADAPDISDGSEWALAQAILHTQDQASYAAWFRQLKRVGRAGGRLSLSAPSRFHASYVQTHLQAKLLAACQSIDDEIEQVMIELTGDAGPTA